MMFTLGIVAFAWRERRVLAWLRLAALVARIIVTNGVAPIPHLDGLVIAYAVRCKGLTERAARICLGRMAGL